MIIWYHLHAVLPSLVSLVKRLKGPINLNKVTQIDVWREVFKKCYFLYDQYQLDNKDFF